MEESVSLTNLSLNNFWKVTPYAIKMVYSDNYTYFLGFQSEAELYDAVAIVERENDFISIHNYSIFQSSLSSGKNLSCGVTLSQEDENGSDTIIGWHGDMDGVQTLLGEPIILPVAIRNHHTINEEMFESLKLGRCELLSDDNEVLGEFMLSLLVAKNK